MIDFDEIAERGEESGREEASADFPYFPEEPCRRLLTWYGRGRAQGRIYRLRGKAAHVFAQNWAMGYEANVSLYELHYPEEVRAAREESEEE